MSGIPRYRSFSGPALWSAGFRPFFLFGAIYAGVTGLLWLPVFEGELSVPTHFSAIDWHVHEMVFGVVPAIIAGFLLTAIPNWTGRLPLQGLPLAVLAIAWLVGRVVVTVSASLPGPVVALADLAFLVLLWLAAAREIVAGKNWRNMRVLAPVAVLILANLAFHIEVAMTGTSNYARRAGVAAVIALIMLIGGRIVPSFTRNWLARRGPGRLPASFDRIDAVAMAVGVFALVLWTIAPRHAATGVALIAAGVLHAVRLARWAGDRTVDDRLVLVLHVAYAFIPLGFIIAGATAFMPNLVPSAAIHAWTVGAIGTMTLAVMSRAAMGHTGRALHASPLLQAIYGAMVIAALARILAAMLPQASFALLHVTALGWSFAYLAFAVMLWPMVTRPRLG